MQCKFCDENIDLNLKILLSNIADTIIISQSVRFNSRINKVLKDLTKKQKTI